MIHVTIPTRCSIHYYIVHRRIRYIQEESLRGRYIIFILGLQIYNVFIDLTNHALELRVYHSPISRNHLF